MVAAAALRHGRRWGFVSVVAYCGAPVLKYSVRSSSVRIPVSATVASIDCSVVLEREVVPLPVMVPIMFQAPAQES